jgi:hypothetical protein
MYQYQVDFNKFNNYKSIVYSNIKINVTKLRHDQMRKKYF